MPSPNEANGTTSMGDDAPKYEEAFPPLPQSTSTAKTPIIVRHPMLAKPMPLSKQSVKTEVFQIPVEERRYQSTTPEFGGRQQDAQRKICQDISHKTNVAIDLTLTKDKSLTVVITGKVEDIKKARSALTKELQTQAQVQVRVPREYHRFLLGKAGSKLKEIELASSTKISLPRSGDQQDIVTVVGAKDGIEVAKKEIVRIVDEQSKLAYERFSIPKIYHPFICGPFNKTINEIRERTKANINIPPPGINSDDLTISGEKNGVLEAVANIKHIYQEKSRKCQSVEIEVKKSQHKYVIGTRGSGLSDILEATDVSVEVPPSDSDSTKIILRGHPDQLGTALSKVYEKAGSSISESIKCPGWLHRFIIGKQGSGLQKITEGREKVRVECSEETSTIDVEGPAEMVEIVVDKLNERVAELERTMAQEDVRIDPKYHKHIVGKAGSNIVRIQSEHNVSVRIPNDANDWIIKIVGDPQGVTNAKQEILAMSTKMENEKQKDVIIDHKYHRMLIGSSGSTIKEIRDRFPQVTINFPDSKAESDVVTVRGPRQAVDQAATYLSKQYTNLVESNYTQEVHVFKQFHKNVIGKGGATIRAIREATGTKIDLPDERAESDVIRITGRKQNVDDAIKRIDAIQKELANIRELSVDIPARLHTLLIGTKGRLIRSIQDECGGVQINFPDSSSKSSDKVIVRGPAEDAEKAKKLLLEMATEKEAFSHQETVSAKSEFHKFLIGKKGSHIHQLRQMTGARVIFPEPTEDDRDIIQVIGSKEAVAKAKAELEKRVKALENVIEEEVTVDPKWHRHFVVRRGQKLEELARDFGGVTISFPKQNTPLPDGAKVRVKGPRDCVQAAIRRIEETVADLAAQVTITVVISQMHHRALIGRNGEQVRDIQNDFNVHIRFPDARGGSGASNHDNAEPINGLNGHSEDVESEEGSEEASGLNGESAPSPCDMIQVTGKLSDCEAARDALQLLVPISEDVELPNEFHRSLIGQRGQGVQELTRRFNVQITIPEASKNLDCIVVKGTKDRIDQVKEALVESMVKWEEEKQDRILRNFEVVVDVPVEHHRRIIGQRGAKINELRDTFGVNIQMPSSDSSGPVAEEEGDEASGETPTPPSDTQIIIRGYQEKAEAAKEKILEMVRTLESYVREEVVIPNEVHPRLIGGRGRTLRKMIDDLGVDITFPGREVEGDASNVVVVHGPPDNVDKACDFIIERANEILDEIEEKGERYTNNARTNYKDNDQTKKRQPGFFVSGAPWTVPDTSSTQDFPSIGNGGSAPTNSRSAPGPWAGKR